MVAIKLVDSGAGMAETVLEKNREKDGDDEGETDYESRESI